MKRGEVWWVNFHLSVCGEIQKQRPAVIVSNDASNKYLNRIQVVLLTTSVDRFYPSEASVIVKGKRNKAMADQLSKRRLQNRMARLSGSDLQGVESSNQSTVRTHFMSEYMVSDCLFPSRRQPVL